MKFVRVLVERVVNCLELDYSSDTDLNHDSNFNVNFNSCSIFDFKAKFKTENKSKNKNIIGNKSTNKNRRKFFHNLKELLALLSLIRLRWQPRGEVLRHILKMQSDAFLALILKSKEADLQPGLRSTKEVLGGLDIGRYLREREKQSSTVYLVASPWIKGKYVGETERSIFKRFDEHLRDSRNYADRRKEWWKLSLLARKMAIAGEVLYIPIPVWNRSGIGEEAKSLRKVKERDYIHALAPGLNRMHRKWYMPAANGLRRLKCQRKNGSKDKRATLPAFYTFETDGMPKTSDLADIYEKMAEGSVKEIRMVKGRIDVTRVTELMTGFVLTRKRWRCLYTSRATWLKPKGNITITLKKETKKGEVALNEEKLLLVKSLTRHPQTKARFLKRAGNVAIRELITIADGALAGREKGRVMNILKKYLLRQTGARDLPLPLIRYQNYQPEINFYLKRLGRRIVQKASIPSSVAAYLSRKMRVLCMKPKSLGDTLCNNSLFAKNFSKLEGEGQDLCCCQAKGKPAGEHLSASLEDFLTKDYGVSLRSDLIPEQEDSNQDTIRTIINFTCDMRVWKYGLPGYRVRKSMLYREGQFLREIQDKEWDLEETKTIKDSELFSFAIDNLQGVGGASVVFKIKRLLLDRRKPQKERGKHERRSRGETLGRKSLADIKKSVRGLVVTPLDKGGKTIWVQCPTRMIGLGLRKFVREEPNFEERDLTEQEALDNIQTLYESCGLSAYKEFRQGSLPSMRLDPKYKDPLLKFRLITSYAGFPMRRLLRNCGRALRFMLKKVHEGGRMKSFTLFKLNDFKERLMRIKNMPNAKALKPWQTDVKCMFTNLSKVGIGGKISKLIEMYTNMHRGKPEGITVRTKVPYTCYRGIRLALDETEDLCFDLIRRVVLWDLQSTYSKFGDIVYFQKEGIPIGGMCSSVYADVQCAFDENEYLQREDVEDENILGIRQIDDLLIFAPNEGYKDQIVASYDKGLTLESEAVEATTCKLGSVQYAMNFIGLDITLKEGKVRSRVANKNLPSIAKSGKQLKPRFAPPSKYRSGQVYKQIITGSLYRVRDYSIGAHQTQQAVEGLAVEFRSIGYSLRFFTSVLDKYLRMKIAKGKQKVWRKALVKLKARRKRGKEGGQQA